MSFHLARNPDTRLYQRFPGTRHVRRLGEATEVDPGPFNCCCCFSLSCEVDETGTPCEHICDFYNPDTLELVRTEPIPETIRLDLAGLSTNTAWVETGLPTFYKPGDLNVSIDLTLDDSDSNCHYTGEIPWTGPLAHFNCDGSPGSETVIPVSIRGGYDAGTSPPQVYAEIRFDDGAGGTTGGRDFFYAQFPLIDGINRERPCCAAVVRNNTISYDAILCSSYLNAGGAVGGTATLTPCAAAAEMIAAKMKPALATRGMTRRQIKAMKDAQRAAASAAGVKNKAGTVLKRALRFFRIKNTLGCGCDQRANLMDVRGCDWCEDHCLCIVRWLKTEAGRMKLGWGLLREIGAFALVKLAIRRARQAA